MSFHVDYRLYICDKSYTKLARVNWLFLQYSQVLNSVTQAYFTVQTQDPAFNLFAFDPINRAYCCIIEREGMEVFRGEIDLITTPTNKTPYGIDDALAFNTLDRLGFNASGQEQRLDNIIVTPDSGSTVYKRSFNGVALGTAVSTLLTEAIARPSSPVSNMTVGTIENPVDKSGNTITLTSTQALYANSTLSWIKVLADLGNADWYRSGSTINFVKRKGVERSDQVKLRLKKGQAGELAGITLNLDRQEMANSVVVVGAQEGINQIVNTSKNDASINMFGLREQVTPIRILDTATTAQQYADKTVQRLSQAVPIDAIQIYPNQDHNLFGSFSLGDTITIDVNFEFIVSKKRVRIMGATVSVTDQGMERAYYSLQEPYD